MRAERSWARQFGSYADFYRAEYGQHVTAIRTIGGLKATLLEAHQTAGDWSDAPTPDLVLAWLSSRSVGFKCDLGAGRFAGPQRTNDAILIAPGVGASIEMDGSHACRALGIPFGGLAKMLDGFQEALPHDGNFGRVHSGPIRDRTLAAQLTALWDEADNGSLQGSLWTDGMLLQVVASLFRLRSGPQQASPPCGLAPWQVRRTTEYLAENLDLDVPLETLAAMVGLSPFHFARQFKRSTGLPPYARLRQLRCERAKEHLTASDRSIGEIAAMVGYETPQAFARMFRVEVGLSPSEYRRKRQS